MKKLKVEPRMTKVAGAIEIMKLQQVKQSGVTQENCTPQVVRAVIEILFEPEGIPVEGRSDLDDDDFDCYVEALNVARWYYHATPSMRAAIMASAQAARKQTAKAFKVAICQATEAA